MQSELPVDSVDDLVLMQRIAQRDQAALELLYHRYSAALLAVAARILPQKSEAEDVLINVFWELWDRAQRYVPDRGAPLSYLLTLTRCRAIDRRRRSGTQPALSLEDRQWNDLSGGADRLPSPSPADNAVLDEKRTRIREAMRQLTLPQRQAVEMAFFDGCSHSEIAEKTGIPLGTVKSHIRLALIRLRETLRTFNDTAKSET